MGSSSILFSILWLIVLLILGWPIAGFCAGFYTLFLPFTACIPDCSGLTDLLLKGVQLPLALGKGIASGNSSIF